MRTFACLALLALIAPPATPSATVPGMEASVVGLDVTAQQWNPDRPWAKNKPATRHPNGVILEGPYILTTAQMIADATFIQVEKFGRITRVAARPYLVDREIDLALLKVETDDFFHDLRPVKLARQTPASGALHSVRWRGQQFESLESRVKRFEVQGGYYGQLKHLFLLAQTDLSGGGWAEPVFDNGHRLVGITVSQKNQAASIIPVEIIARFLQRAGRPGSPGDFPVFGALWQVNEDPALAAYLGQSGEPHGVLIRQVPWGSSACGVLHPRDLLLSVDGKPVDADGFYTHPRLGQLQFTHLLTDLHRVGDTIPLQVLRRGHLLDLEMTLRAYPVSMMLLPEHHGDDPPPYIVAGGLVLRELDGDYMRSWGSKWTTRAPLRLLGRYFQKRNAQRPGQRRIILLTSVLPSHYNVGYQNLRDVVVEEINSFPIDSILDVAEALKHPRNGFHTFVLEPGSSRREIVLDADGLHAATAEILEQYRIPQPARMPATPPPDGGPDCPGDF
ncbi:MAG: PDZ domain-containing protein [Acidobacteriota bacterium]